jgi:pyruvate dehydrogenase E1 component alpha subunit
MADPAKYRTEADVEGWKSRDPIKTLGEKLDALGYKTARENIDRQIEDEIMDAVKFAEESPFPALDTASDYVYA